MNTKRWPIFVIGLLVGAGLVAAAFKLAEHRQSAAEMANAPMQKAHYQCPMHPTVVSDKPEHCPICGMKLQRMDEQAPGQPEGRGKILYYRNPMNPTVTSKTPTKDNMNMDYVPVYENEEGGQSEVSGLAVVKLPQWRQQLIGIKTTTAAIHPLHVSIRTVGRIAYDPDLYTAMTEYREAVLSREKTKASRWPDVREGADALVTASAIKLKLMGLGQEQIDALDKEKAPTNLLLGRRGGTLWVYADVYESDVALVKAGESVAITLSALPGRTFQGTIKAVDPVLNPSTRTLRVRAEVSDPQGQLKPEMFVNASIEVPLGEKLAVPIDAVLDTGERQTVFVEVSDGEFAPREVKVGRQADAEVEILSGLKAGEKIVTQANFLLDSESKLRAAGQKASEAKP